MNVVLEPLRDREAVVVHVPKHSAVYDPNQRHPVERAYLTPGEFVQLDLHVGTRRYDVRVRVAPADTPPEATVVASVRTYLAQTFGIEPTDEQATLLARLASGLDAVPVTAQSRSQGN